MKKMVILILALISFVTIVFIGREKKKKLPSLLRCQLLLWYRQNPHKNSISVHF